MKGRFANRPYKTLCQSGTDARALARSSVCIFTDKRPVAHISWVPNIGTISLSIYYKTTTNLNHDKIDISTSGGEYYGFSGIPETRIA